MKLFSLSDKLKNKRKNSGYLFIAYLMDEHKIMSVWRINAVDESHTFNDFILSLKIRYEECNFIPDLRVYLFEFQNMNLVPLLSSDNSHFIDFVSNKEPQINLSIIEAIYLLDKELPITTVINENSPFLDDFQIYIENIEKKEDETLWQVEIVKDPQSTDYDLLANLILKYEHQPAITERQIELLNNEKSALRIFHTLQEYFEQTDYILNGWDLNDFNYLIHVPANQRTPLHIIRAELFKIIDLENKTFGTHPDKNKMEFELNIFLSGMNVDQDWENKPIPEIWKKAACYCMTDAEAVADAISSFQYVPSITEEQINYLLRTGTVAETFVESGIMGNIFTKTPLFHLKYGPFLERFKTDEPTPMDKLVINSLYLLAKETHKKLSEKKEIQTLSELHTIENTISIIEAFWKKYNDEKTIKLRTQNLNQLKQCLNKIAEMTKELDNLEDILLTYDEDYFTDLIRSNSMDIELSIAQCNLLLSYVTQIPVEIIKKAIAILKGHEYGKLPEHADLSLEGVINASQKYPITPLQKLILLLEKYKQKESIDRIRKEINDLNRQSHRISESISDCEDKLEEKKKNKQNITKLLNEFKIE